MKKLVLRVRQMKTRIKVQKNQSFTRFSSPWLM